MRTEKLNAIKGAIKDGKTVQAAGGIAVTMQQSDKLGYSMVILGQVYTLTELSEPALKALTVTLGGKVLSNIFEHNNNKFFGTSVGSTDAEGGV